VGSDDVFERMTASGEHEYKAALRVMSESVRLAELVAVLGEPTTAHDIGDVVGRLGGVRKHASWALEAAVERTVPLDEHVEFVVAFAEAKRDGLASLRARGCRADVFCGVFAEPDAQGGWVLGPLVLRRLGDLELPVVFDLY